MSGGDGRAAPTGRDGAGALLVVDLQEGFFSDPGLQDARARLLARVERLVRAAVDAGALVVEVRTVHEADGSTWALNQREDDSPFMVRDRPETAPLAEVAALREELADARWHVVEKTRDSAFHRTGLAELLGDHEVAEVVVCGVTAESCIAVTATEAYAHDLYVTIAQDAVASGSATARVEALRRLDDQYRQPAVSSDDVSFRRVG